MPPIKVPAHVISYSVACIPAVAYAFYYHRNHPTEEEFKEKLTEKYAQNINKSKSQHEEMAKFLQALKHPGKHADTEDRMAEVLQSGKSGIKRHYAVDKRYYGTTEGLEAKKRVEQELRDKKALKQQRRKQKEQSGASLEKNAETKKELESNTPPSPTKKEQTLTPQGTSVTLVVVAASAAAIGFLLGGSRN